MGVTEGQALEKDQHAATSTSVKWQTFRAVQQVEVPQRFKEKESNRFATQKYSAEKKREYLDYEYLTLFSDNLIKLLYVYKLFPHSRFSTILERQLYNLTKSLSQYPALMKLKY